MAVTRMVKFLVLVLALAAASESVALGAGTRTRSVHESATLHRTSRHGTVVTEQGVGSGTFNCPISVRIEVEENTLQFRFTCATSRGSINGYGTIHLHVADPISHVSGSVNLGGGRGIWAHDEGRGLRVGGTVNSKTYAGTLSVSGTMTHT